MLGFKSVAKAEEAAYNGGGGTDWDSQNCRDFQQTVLSSPFNSSPARQQRKVGASINTAITPNPSSLQENIIDNHEENTEDPADDEDDLNLVLPQDWTAGHNPEETEVNQQILGITSPRKEEAIADTSPTSHAVPNGTQSVKTVLGRDSKGRLRPFDHQGNLVEPTRRRVSNKTMEEEPNSNGTQKSSMSLTQENSESAYDAYRRKQAQSSANNSPALPSAYTNSKNQSLFTESTAHSYNENDTGHIAFDLAHVQEDSRMDHTPEVEMEVEAEDELSQDPIYSPRKFDPPQNTPFAPETPAPPINPFGDKGHVMNPLDLFKATQASSAMRAPLYSPTSSRPSPNIYNELNTPSRIETPSSPTKHGLEDGLNLPSSAPLSDMVAGEAVSQSPAFRTAPENPQSSPVPQPRAYVTMKESQERRRLEAAEIESDSGSDSDGSVSSMEAVVSSRREKINRAIAREQSAVSVSEPRLARTSSRIRSSPPVISTVEVPSTSTDAIEKTGRRRSIQDDYLAQCTGSDARDTQQNTQQDDIIADSQLYLESDIAQSTSQIAESSLPQPHSVHGHPSSTTAPSQYYAPTPSLPPSQMLPPLVVHEAPNNFDTIPETSPVRSDRIRPMGEIASFRGDSFSGEEAEVEPEHYPGFSQDQDFDQAIGNVQEPTKSRTNSQRRAVQKPLSLSRSRDSSEMGRKSPVILTESTFELPANRESTEIESSAPCISSSLQRSPTSSSTPKPVPTAQESTEVDDVESLVPAEVPSVSAVPQSLDTPFKIPEKKTTHSPEPSNATSNASEVESSTASRSKQRNNIASKLQTPIPSAEPLSSALSSLPDMDTDDEIFAAPEDTDMSNVQDDSMAAEDNAADELDLPAIPISTPVGHKGKGLIKYGKGHSSKKPRRAAKSSSPAQDDLANSSPSVAVLPKAAQKAKTAPKKRGRKPLLPKPQPRDETPVPATKKKAPKRKSAAVLADTEAPTLTRSKRKSTGQILRDSSEDPLALGFHPTSSVKRKISGLFSNMAFAVSYVADDEERDNVTKLIRANGGQILEDGFDTLFNKSVKTSSNDAKELELLPITEKIGFVSLIANKHSRKAKYMQALALGLPCISGKWIHSCLGKDSILDWSVYLLGAGDSALLGGACRSRTLQPYAAAGANFVETFEQRDQLLNEKSVLVITGNAKRLESRNAYVWLAKALGPSRIGYAIDLLDARKKLVEAEKDGDEWDIVYVDNETFGSSSKLFEDASAGGSRKRKRASTAESDDTLAPKRVRVICDETVMQSLIVGKLMDE